MDFEDKIIAELEENLPKYKFAAKLTDIIVVSGVEAYILIDIFICNHLNIDPETGKDLEYVSSNLALEMLRLTTSRNKLKLDRFIERSKKRKPAVIKHNGKNLHGETEEFVFKLDDPFFEGINLQINSLFWFTISEFDHRSTVITKIIDAKTDPTIPDIIYDFSQF